MTGNQKRVSACILRKFTVAVFLCLFSSYTSADNRPACKSSTRSINTGPQVSSVIGKLQAIVVGNGAVVAVGIDTILVSTDGKTWVRHRLNEYEPHGNRYLVDVLWDGEKFVALSISGKVYISDENGQNWTARSEIWIADTGGGRVQFRKLQFNKGLYVALSDSEAANAYLSYGDDALLWKTDRINGFQRYGAMAQMLWANDRYYIAAGAGTVEPYFMRGKMMLIGVEFLPTAATGITHDGSQFYRVVHGRTDISRSVDGKLWETLLSLAALPSGSRLNTIPMRTMRYLNGKYLIAGGNGVFISSENGTDWEIDFTESEAYVEDIVWTGTEYLAVGGKHSGVIFRSLDGRKWVALANGDIAVREAQTR